MSKHERGLSKGQFCGIPGTPCECGNDYIEICNPGWNDYTFSRLIRRKKGPWLTFQKKYEAHHVVCVAPVAQEIVSKKSIESVIAQTQWCINNKDNMIAMPLWGHTVKWYCDISADGGDFAATISVPPFANIPQHDWDHNCNDGYTWEVVEAAKKVAKKIEQAGHEIKTQDIAAALNSLSSKFKNILLAVRGTRKGGTHAAWLMALDDPDSDWCQPFSMASTVALTRKGFPVRKFDESVAKWIERIAEAIRGGP